MKEKFREIEINVQTVALQSYEEGYFHNLPFFRTPPGNAKNGDYIKCILRIPVMEKKIEVTESLLESVLNETETLEGMFMYNRIKNKLFRCQS